MLLSTPYPPRVFCCCFEACIGCSALGLLRAELHNHDQTQHASAEQQETRDPGTGCTLVVWAFGKLAGWSPGFAV